jgi:hypothetical protein
MSQHLIEACKQALEALEYEASCGNDDAYRIQREALRTAIGQAEKQEQCAKALEALPSQWADQPGIAQAERATILECVQTIRSRGNL